MTARQGTPLGICQLLLKLNRAPLMTMQDLDVFLREDRNYVQGTQIISRIADLLDGDDWALRQAEFRRLSIGLLKVAEVDGPQSDDAIGSVQFVRSTTGEARTFAVLERQEAAPRMQDGMVISVERSGKSAVSAETDEAVWTYSNVCGFEDVLNAIVQAIKAEHKLLWPGASDIWLTGLRNLGLPVKAHRGSLGSISLVLWRKLQGSSNVQTFWQVRLPESDLAGMVSFAYRD